jgi:hypothetical protein
LTIGTNKRFVNIEYKKMLILVLSLSLFACGIKRELAKLNAGIDGFKEELGILNGHLNGLKGDGSGNDLKGLINHLNILGKQLGASKDNLGGFKGIITDKLDELKSEMSKMCSLISELKILLKKP